MMSPFTCSHPFLVGLQCIAYLVATSHTELSKDRSSCSLQGCLHLTSELTYLGTVTRMVLRAAGNPRCSQPERKGFYPSVKKVANLLNLVAQVVQRGLYCASVRNSCERGCVRNPGIALKQLSDLHLHSQESVLLRPNSGHTRASHKSSGDRSARIAALPFSDDHL